MTVWIIEDEAAAARRLEKLILEIDGSVVVTARLDSIKATLLAAAGQPLPDLLFMDIHLADGDSFEIFRHLRIDKPVIFTTAYDAYALQAFKVNAIDYLLKPMKSAELRQALDKYKQLHGAPLADYEELAKVMRPPGSEHRFMVRTGQQIRVVSMGEVAYFFTEDKMTLAVTWAGRRYPLDVSLEKLEELAAGLPFFRINRQFIVHQKSIGEMYAYSKSRVRLTLQPTCATETVVSTERSPHFKRWLKGEG